VALIVLHTIWDCSASALHIWAESSDHPAPKRSKKQVGTSRLHPFVLPISQLREVIAGLVGNLPVHDALPAALILHVPSTSTEPLPSPELMRGEEETVQGKIAFAPWQVTTLQLDASHALDALLHLPPAPPRSLAFGSSLRFWTQAAQLAFELVTRQCFLPALHESQHEDGNVTLRAGWDALLSPTDRERVRVLAQAMPPVCWSAIPASEQRASLLSELLLHFLNHTIDAFVRESLSSTTLLPVSPGNGRAARALPERWLRALSSDDPTLVLSAKERKAFSAAMHAWLDQLRPTTAEAPFRTLFKLDPPFARDNASASGEDQEEGAEDAKGDDARPTTWHLSFHLQANDDRSLLIPAEKVWQERSSTLTFLKRQFENPQERLLEDLGRASRVFPLLEESLETARPQELALDTQQAYMFLRETAPLLEDSGFGVLIPPWWQKRSARVGVKLKVRPKADAKTSSGLLGMDSLVDYNWNIAIGDTTLTLKEFEKLVNLKVPLVKVRGQWVELRPEEIEAAIAFFQKKQARQQMTLGEALRVGLGQEQSALGLPVLDMEAEGWIREIMDRLTQRVQLAPIEVPPTFHGQLRPYQHKGVSWLAFLKQFGFGSCLADDMGLGKCLTGNTPILLNGTLKEAEAIWHDYAEAPVFDGEGYWADPTAQLWTNSIDETGRIVESTINHLYREHVSTRLRKIHLEDGNSITITYPHKLLTDKGWTNDLYIGNYVCVPAKSVWEGQSFYREKPPSKWTMKTLGAYKHLEREALVQTKVRLQHLLDQEVYYCRIKEIEDIQYEGWVYDFEVEKHHNFVANNILCHNTIQLITLLLHEHEDAKAANLPLKPTLLICPMSIVGNWQREITRFAPSLSVMIHHGMERLSGEAFTEEARRHDIVITTYSLALRDKEHLSAVEWENVVIDEAQNIKNESAKQTQAIKSLQAGHKIALTGTPVENRLSELWSIMEFLNPGYLGSGSDFRKNFALPIERYRSAEQAALLKKLIQPFVLRRVKTDREIIQDLPDKMEMKVFCNLTQEQASLYEAVVKDMMEKIEEAEEMQRRGLILATLMKLKQVCNHPAQFMADSSLLANRSGKLARLDEMLEEVLAEGDKALIFTQFAEMGSLLRKHLQETLGCETLFLHGGTSKKQRDVMVQRFQEERHGPQLFILSIKAGGVGLNLTAANHVFHFDRWWNPAVENQATDRAFRIGQKKNVQVHKFVCIGTLEERIDQMIEQKKELAESIVSSGENWLTEMSTTQLKELFALSREAVGE